MKTPSKLILFILIAISTFLGVYIFFQPKAPTVKLPTYFSYTAEELDSLKGLSSKSIMQTEDVYFWDKYFFDLVSKESLNPKFDESAAGLYAYMTVAERDAAHISYNLTGTFVGDLKPVPYEVICFFYPDQCHNFLIPKDTDEYSKKLAALVMKKVKERAAADEKGRFVYPEKIGDEFWQGPQPSVGRSEGSRITWLIQKGSQFRVPPPPVYNSPEMREQLQLTKKIFSEATDTEKQATVFWAGGPGTKTPAGLWFEIADHYLQEKKTSFSQTLDARALLTMAIADANIAVFDSKYSYWAKRPFMYDSSIVTVMPTPNHPSYPAGHSALSTAAATVLSSIFPEAEAVWKKQAEEAGLSRVWGGIHFMIDHQQSEILGKKVGEEAVHNFSY